jgi:type I restriction enzyme S subunit
MPDHWQATTLGGVARVVSDRVDPTSLDNEVYVGLEHLETNARRLSMWGSSSDVSSATTPFRAGDTLFGRLRPYLRKGCIAPFAGVCSPEILVIRRESGIDPQFLGLVVLSDAVFAKCDQVSAGSRMPRTSAEDLMALPVNIPPHAEQRRIVDLVGSIDSYIDSLQRQAEATRAARSALLAELLSNSGDDWQSTTLGESVQLNPESIRGYDSSFEFRYIDIGSVSEDFGINEEGLERHVVQSAPSRAQRIVRFCDVLVSTVRPNLRAFATVPASLDGEVASTGFVVLRAGQQVEPGYVWALVRTDAFVRHLVDRATGSSYPAVRASDVGSFPFEIPPIAEQRRIVDLIGSIDKQVASLETQAKSAQLFRGGVVSELLSGERLLDESYDVAFSS